MAEGNRRQAAVMFVIAGVFLVGVFLVGLGLVKQQNKSATTQPTAQPSQTHPKQQAETKNQDKPAAEKRSNAQPETPQRQPAAATSPAAAPAQGEASELPATGTATDLVLGATLLACVVFALLRFRQSKLALLPKL